MSLNPIWKTSNRTYNNLIELSKQIHGLKNDLLELGSQKVLSSRSYKIVVDYLVSRLNILNTRFELIRQDYLINKNFVQIKEYFSVATSLFKNPTDGKNEQNIEITQIFELFQHVEKELNELSLELEKEKNRIGSNKFSQSYPSKRSTRVDSSSFKGKRKKLLRRATERTGLVPRSIIRTLKRFFIQLNPSSESIVVQEFRISRYQGLVALRTFLTLAVVPSAVSEISKRIFFKPLIEYFWNQNQNEIFLNHSQQERAFQQLKDFEEQLYFEELLSHVEDFEKLIGTREFNVGANQSGYIAEKMIEIAKEYNHETIDSLVTICGDLTFGASLVFLGWLLRPQLIILQSFIIEFLYALSDTTKSFFIILLTELLVGFHSLNGWEVFLKSLLERFGLPENEDFIMLCVATFPVLLDTAFKYWIFRYLNKLSPSTVVTYHSMIE
jgi:hypothetical protein